MSVAVGLPIDDNYDPIPLRTFQRADDSDLSDIEKGFEIDDSPNSLFATPAEEQPVCVLQVTIRKPVTPGSMAAIAWSLFPYAVPIFSVLSFIRHAAEAAHRGESIAGGYSGFLLYYICLALFGVLLNEKVLKRIVQEPRPAASACKGYGMPSGHSTNCFTWMVWTLVEILSHPSPSAWFTIFLLCLTVFVLAPVPYARVYLQDHTREQVMVGMAVGTILGLLAAPIRLWLFPNATPLWLVK
jgi:membrane-associated phospholipid phosphatase